MRWKMAKLGDVVDILKGKKPSTVADSLSPETPAAYVTIEAFEFGQPVQFASVDSNAVLVQQGDVVIVWDGARFGMVGTAIPGVLGSTLATFKSDGTVLNRDFLRYFLSTKLNVLQANKRGSGIPHLDATTLRELPIPLPPLEEQRRIVEILDEADRLRKLRRQADAIAERILPALFYKMFGDPVQLMSNEQSVALEQLPVEMQNGFACGEKAVIGGVPHLRMNNIDDKGILNLQLLRTVPVEMDKEVYRLKDRDVLFMGTNSEDKIGKTCLFYRPDGRNYLFSNHLVRLRVTGNQLSPEYLATFLHLLWQKGFYPSLAKRWVNQSTVSQTALGKLKIFVPDRSKLDVFSEEYTTMLNLMKQRSEAAAQLERLHSTLLHRAFTGELTKRWREEQGT